jgi:hypothetical protein
MSELKPANKGMGPTYDPQGSGMDHDSIFREVATGPATSGNLKYKWGGPTAHTKLSAPPTGLKGE